MAQIDPNTKPNPIVAVLGNFFCILLGYVLCGQTKKGIMVFAVSFLASIATFFVGGLGGMVVGILGLMDVHAVAVALNAGEAVDENEYKQELLHKLVSFIDKTAVLKGAE